MVVRKPARVKYLWIRKARLLKMLEWVSIMTAKEINLSPVSITETHPSIIIAEYHLISNSQGPLTTVAIFPFICNIITAVFLWTWAAGPTNPLKWITSKNAASWTQSPPLTLVRNSELTHGNKNWTKLRPNSSWIARVEPLQKNKKRRTSHLISF